MVVQWVIGALILLFGFVVFRGAPYVPSRKRYIQEAFTELYPVGPRDTLIDVGSGDGIVLRLASKAGAHAIGYELNPALVLIARLLSRGDRKVEVRLADFWRVKLPAETTVVYAFMVTRDMKKFARKMQQEATRLERSVQVILYGNEMPQQTALRSVGAYHLYRFDPSPR